MEAIHEETRNGYDIKIVPDEYYSENPNDWGDTEVFLVAFHRDFSVERKGFGVEVCRELAQAKKNRDADYKEQCAEIEKEYHVFGLEAYIHSGVSLSLSNEGQYPDRQWDVSQLGLVFVSKKTARMHKKARALALGLLKTWNAVMSGSVYGYIVERDGEQLDSCWGYIEEEWNIEKTSVLAEARDIADWHYKNDPKRTIKQDSLEGVALGTIYKDEKGKEWKAIDNKVTKAQHNALKAKAKKLGISVSEFIRSMIKL